MFQWLPLFLILLWALVIRIWISLVIQLSLYSFAPDFLSIATKSLPRYFGILPILLIPKSFQADSIYSNPIWSCFVSVHLNSDPTSDFNISAPPLFLYTVPLYHIRRVLKLIVSSLNILLFLLYYEYSIFRFYVSYQFLLLLFIIPFIVSCRPYNEALWKKGNIYANIVSKN